ncbi:MAG TPA: hypothetical protein VHO25_13620, partial [Polyangiaceae bacterium]|nr:hypothetical protein [Polyangiaceae bacterium]
MNRPDPERLLEDAAISDELRLGLQELRDHTPAPEQLARIVAGLSATGVAVTASTAQASTVSTAGSATVAKAVPTVGNWAGGKVALWKLALLAIVPAGAALIVAVLPSNDERPHSALSSPEQNTVVHTSAAPSAVAAVAHGRDLPTSSAAASASAAGATRDPVAEHAPDEPSSPEAEGALEVRAGADTLGQRTAAAASTALRSPVVPRDPTGRIATPHSTEATRSVVAAPSTVVPARSEVELLQTASTVLGGNPAEALQLCEEHRKLYPGGAMSQEREMIAVTALVRLGRQEEAYSRAEQFRRNYPKSAYLRQIDKVVPPR